jgi:hypothetical protein
MIPATAYDAGQLLDELRPGIEEILSGLARRWPDKIPTCQSQSLRALRGLPLLEAFSKLRRRKPQDGREPPTISDL